MNIFDRLTFRYLEEADDGSDGGSGDDGDKGDKGDGDKSLLPGGEGDNTLADGEYFLSEGIKGVGEKPEWYQGDRYKSVTEQAKAYGELEKKFGSHTGTPKDGYNLGDDMDKEDALVTEFITFATESGMNQDGFDKGIKLFMEAVGVKESVDTQAEMDKLGDNAEGRLKTVENFMKNNMESEDYDKLSKHVNTAGVVELVEKLIRSTAPQKLPIDGGENPTGVTWKDIEKEMFRKNENGDLLRSVDREHEAKIQRMMKTYGGNKPNVKIIS